MKLIKTGFSIPVPKNDKLSVYAELNYHKSDMAKPLVILVPGFLSYIQWGFYPHLVKMLVENAETPVERSKLLDVIWGLEGFPTTRTVDNHIVSLRRKVEPDSKHPRHIVAVHSIGYKFVP